MIKINRLDIDYKIIDKLDHIVNSIDECLRICDWDLKEKLEKMYFNIYDQLDINHKYYIEDEKREN